MGCEYICDGCGAREGALDLKGPDGLVKPPRWYELADEDGTYVACSRHCIELIKTKTGKEDIDIAR